MSRKHQKRREVIIMRGPSASGKSTDAKQRLISDKTYARVCQDNLRYMINDYADFNRKIEEAITPVEYHAAENFLLSGYNIIWDNTFVRPKHLKGVLNLLDKLRYYRGFDIQIDTIDYSNQDIETLVNRDQNNDRISVGREVIEKQVEYAIQNKEQFYSLIDEFHSQPVGYFMDIHQFDEFKQDAIVMDIDGTLALIGDRGPFDWQNVDKDYVNPIMKHFIDLENNLGNNIILMSGRSEDAREKTISWLNKFNIHYDYLFMRPANNYEKDDKIKKQLFDNQVGGFFNVYRAYDDRLTTTQVWHNKGIYTINVNQGNINF